MKTRLISTFCLAVFATLGYSQSWSEAYERALSSVVSGNWTSARDAFKQAVALRPEDQSTPTSLPGSSKKWRSGSAYSPNFGSAYCLFRIAQSQSGPEKNKSLKTAAIEFETLLAKNQLSAETYYFLSRIYSLASDVISSDALGLRLREDISNLEWRVDSSLVTPEERSEISTITQKPTSDKNPTPGPTTTIVKATDKVVIEPFTSIGAPATAQDSLSGGRIPSLAKKFALVIGNGESAMSDAKLSFASTDALLIRDSLIQNAGFAIENVDVVINATAVQLAASVGALAERLPQDATVLIYFTGYGVHIGGKDYYSGVDAESTRDSSHMVAVSDVYKLFLAKGAYIFAFNQTSRAINSGLYFGKETPLFGRISQSQATIPGAKINSLVSGGQEVGAYTAAFADILADFRSNQIPIMEFSWQVFYKMRRGGGPQTPTLPVLTVISADARF